MPRPCACGRCRLCWLYEHDDAYRRHWDGDPAPTRSRVSVRLCIHLGAPVRGQDAPDLVRDWRKCEKGHGTVCACGACKTCPDFQADN